MPAALLHVLTYSFAEILIPGTWLEVAVVVYEAWVAYLLLPRSEHTAGVRRPLRRSPQWRHR